MKSKIFVLSALWICCASAAAYFLYQATHQPKSSALPRLNAVPHFTAVTENRRMVSDGVFRDKVNIVDFIFTTCQGPCPMMTSTLEGIQSRIPAEKRIHMYSFTVDPETDTPEVLSEYGRTYHADPSRWTFLRCDWDSLQGLVRHGFRLAVENPDSGDIIHSTKFVLIDGTGTIRGYYDSDETNAVDRLVADALELEGEQE